MEPIANRVGKPAPDEAQIIFQKIRSEFMRLIGKYLKGFNFTRSGFIFRRTVGGDVQMIEFQHAWLMYRLSAGVLFDGFEMNGYSGMRGYPRIDDGVGVGLSQLVDGYPTAVPYRLEDIERSGTVSVRDYHSLAGQSIETRRVGSLSRSCASCTR